MGACAVTSGHEAGCGSKLLFFFFFFTICLPGKNLNKVEKIFLPEQMNVRISA